MQRCSLCGEATPPGHGCLTCSRSLAARFGMSMSADMGRPTSVDPLAQTSPERIFAAAAPATDGDMDPPKAETMPLPAARRKSQGRAKDDVLLDLSDGLRAREVKSQSVNAVFDWCCGGREEMDRWTWAKLCRDSRLIDHKVKHADIDVLFSSVCVRGQRGIGRAQFNLAVDLLAQRKGTSAEAVRRTVARSTVELSATA
mmetsp:Transcript_48867/g.126004  ORF Transcript_48867/g.126004 Transcript_48867/m.126004 type:complete len:200 (+) Transcript_48867:1-600(+)